MVERKKPITSNLTEKVQEQVNLTKTPAKWREGAGGATAARTSAGRKDYQEKLAQEKLLRDQAKK